MPLRDIFTLLRIPFSWFLMPVFLFAVSQATHPDWYNTVLLFIILHFFIYPASNAYNSYMDKDEGSIGGVKQPPKSTVLLFYVSILFDVVGILISVFISIQCAICILAYIVASRLYSYRGVRLKQYAVIGWLTVVLFQGGFTYFLTQQAIGVTEYSYYALLGTTLLIGGVYPLTQVYQHHEDAKDGVKTISMLLGYKGTFVFTIIMFLGANGSFFLHYNQQQKLNDFMIFSIALFPTVCYFLYWFFKVSKNVAFADFKHTMIMNVLASSSLNIFFGWLIYQNHFA